MIETTPCETRRSGATASLLYSLTCDENALSGYAVNVAEPLRPVVVEVFFDSMFFCRIRCVDLVNVRRLDLQSLIGRETVTADTFKAALKGRHVIACGFRYELPAYLRRDRPVRIVVRTSIDGAPPETIFDVEVPLDRTALGALGAVHDRWPRIRFTSRSLSNGALSFNVLYGGVNGDRELVPRASRNDLPVSFEAHRLEAPPSGYYTHARQVPFTSVNGSVELARAAGMPFEIRMHDSVTGDVVGDYQSTLFVPGDVEREFADWAIPDAPRMTRVMGFASPLEYYLGGYATFRCIDESLQKAAGRSVATFDSILDWGVGCGRVTQHVCRRTSSAIHGIDIDPDNVGWVTQHLTRGVYSVTPLHPEAPVPAGSMDLIIGMSVFTHLDARAQWEWLQELHRILRPGGMAVVSIKSLYSLYVHPHPVQSYWNLVRHGIDDLVIGTLLDDVLPEGEETYYRETNHSHQYILEQWCRWFDVLGIYVGAFFDYQDICVLKRRDFTSCRQSFL